MELENKIAVITGAGQGIGQAICYSMAKEGAKIVIYDLNPKTAKETSEELTKLGFESIYASGSVSDKEDVKNMFKLVISKFGRIDILVNNAGICKLGPIEEMDEKDWDLVFDVNAKGLFLCTQEAVKIMKKQNKGCIINMTSMHGLQGMPERGPYGDGMRFASSDVETKAVRAGLLRQGRAVHTDESRRRPADHRRREPTWTPAN